MSRKEAMYNDDSIPTEAAEWNSAIINYQQFAAFISFYYTVFVQFFCFFLLLAILVVFSLEADQTRLNMGGATQEYNVMSPNTMHCKKKKKK